MEHPCVGDTGNHVTYGKCPIDREVQKTKKPGWQNGKRENKILYVAGNTELSLNVY